MALAATLFVAIGSVASTAAQTATVSSQPTGWLLNQQSLIQPGVLPAQLEQALELTGSRMMTADKAQIAYTGTITDAQGPRTAQITIQAPGYLLYRDSNNHSVAFNGSALQSTSGALSSSDEAIAESLLAHFPDMVCLQVATGGSYRRIGTHFRTDNGKTPNYTGPSWTLLAFAPSARTGLTLGAALQQNLYVALDEETGYIAEVRTVVNTGPKQQQVTETQFSNWTQLAGQWYPASIVRLESGTQTLSFQVQSIVVGQAGPTTGFVP
jgi:hypothetical protein